MSSKMTKTMISSEEQTPDTVQDGVEPKKRNNTAALIVITLAQLCLKVVWQSVLAAIANMDQSCESGRNASTGATAMLTALALADGIIQLDIFMSLEGPSGVFRAGCGTVLALIYALFCLLFTTSLFDILRLYIWTGVFFNVGCLLELRWPLFQRAVEGGLDDCCNVPRMLGHMLSEVANELPDDLPRVMFSGLIGGITCFLLSLLFS